jgi:hypothetical protein
MSVTEQSVQVELVTASASRPLRAALRYDDRDPLAVTVTFPAALCLDGAEAVWAFSRDLLDTGLRAPAGEGDVQLWPAGPHHTMLGLHAPGEGMALVELSTSDLRRFLHAAYARVPRGAERVTGDALDRGLADLLRGV